MLISRRMNREWLPYLLLVLLAFVWGSSFILMQTALFDDNRQPVLSVYQVGSLRILVSGIVLLPFALRSVKKVPSAAWKWLFLVGFLGSTIPAFLFPAAQLKLPSNIAGMLNSLTPVFTMIVGFLVFRVAVRRNQVLGILVGLVGAIVVIAFSKQGGDFTFASVGPALLIVVATVLYAFSVNIMRHRLVEIPSVAVASLALTMLAIPCGVVFFMTDPMTVLETNPAASKSFLAVVVLSVFSTAIATIVFNRLIQLTSAMFGSSVTYIIPVFAAMWGFFFNEAFSQAVIVGAAIILVGVYLINRKPASV
jgi:drug/metabolite transporter (DMT)-like permease